MHELFDFALKYLIEFVDKVGYIGIFIGMFLESTLIPIPSELVMIPAGIAASKGLMNIYVVTIIGIIGNVSGAVFSYYLAKTLGRKILFKIGKYFFVKPEAIIKIENFFKNYGNISVFMGRLIPGFRHFISLPAGVAQMDLKAFYLYTTLGSGIWTSILAAMGFFVGSNENLIKENLHQITIAFAFCAAVFAFVMIRKRKK